MKNILILFFFFLTGFSNAQKLLIKGIVLDKNTYEPLEFVDVYNEVDYTSTNSEGIFEFSTKETTINFNILGFEKFSTTLGQIKSDTIYLIKKIYELEEIVVYNENALLKKVFNNIIINYPFEPYNETFFLRSLLRKNQKIVKLQDVSGILNRKILLATSKKPMPNKNYVLLVNNMRKAGVIEQDIYFEMFSFEKLLNSMTSIYVSPKSFDFKKSTMKDSDLIKLNFYPNTSSKYKSEGYYIVNSKDNAFNEFYLIDEFKTRPYVERRGIHYRTTFYELLVKFKKNKIDGKYYLNKAKINATVEVLDETSKIIIYNAQYQWFGINLINTKVKNNVSIKKDIFKIDKLYDSDFWKAQNILPLTEEMKSFLFELSSSEKKGFKYISK